MIVNNIMTLDARRKSLYPELFMSAEEREQANTKLAEQVKAEMTAKGLNATMDVSNQLGSATDNLWQVVAPQAIDAVSKKYFNLSNTTHTVEYGVPGNPAVCPPVMVEVVKDAGEAIEDAENWEQSALVNSYVPVTLHRYSRPFVLYNKDLMAGERIATKISAAVEAVVSRVVNKFFGTAFAADGGVLNVDADTFSPEFVAHNVSRLFSEFGGVDDLVLSPDFFSKLVPTNALSLGTGPGTYGIGNIHCSAGLNTQPAEGSAKVATSGLHGLALRRNGIAAAFGVPDLSNLTNIAVRSLGTVAGIPLILKSWVNAGTEGIWNSVETLAGFAVANETSIVKLSTENTENTEDA